MQERRGVGGLERWEVNKSEAARWRRAGGRAGREARLQVEQSRGCVCQRRREKHKS